MAMTYDAFLDQMKKDLEARAEPKEGEYLVEDGLLYRGIATRADVTRITRRLGDDIARVYGFSIPRMKQPPSLERQ